MSIITILQFTSTASAICSVYAAVMSLCVSDASLKVSDTTSEKSLDILQYRGVSYVRSPQNKIEIIIEN